jgi:hypothetical protein
MFRVVIRFTDTFLTMQIAPVPLGDTLAWLCHQTDQRGGTEARSWPHDAYRLQKWFAASFPSSAAARGFILECLNTLGLEIVRQIEVDRL